MLDKQLQNQKALLEEGFKKKAEAMNGEIQRLRHNVEDMKKNSGSVFETILGGFATVISAPVLLIAEAARGIASLFK